MHSRDCSQDLWIRPKFLQFFFCVKLEGSILEWLNSVLNIFKWGQFFLPAMHFGKKSVFLWFWFLSFWNQCFFGKCPFLYCCADCSCCSCCSCCCSSEIGLTFLHNVLDPVSSSGSWKRLWSLMTVVERSVSFSQEDLALFSAVLSFDFPFLRILGNE